jgi:hypothetical protein
MTKIPDVEAFQTVEMTGIKSWQHFSKAVFERVFLAQKYTNKPERFCFRSLVAAPDSLGECPIAIPAAMSSA